MVCFAHSMGGYARMFKILVVEDDKELNRSVCSYLGRNGYDAIGCLNADDAHTGTDITPIPVNFCVQLRMIKHS